jgi:predicted RecA/RadA family phage recombinase
MQATVHQSPSLYVDHTPDAAVAAGDVVLVGNKVLVCVTAIEASRLGALAADGVFKVAKDDTIFAAGDDVYWDPDADPVGGTAGDGAASGVASISGEGEAGLYMGWTPLAADTDDTHVYVVLGQPAPED